MMRSGGGMGRRSIWSWSLIMRKVVRGPMCGAHATVLADPAPSDMGFSATAHEARYIRVVQHARGADEHKISGMHDCACGFGCRPLGGRPAGIQFAEVVCF